MVAGEMTHKKSCAVIGILLLSGCKTVAMAPPWPCDRIEDRPKIDAELRQMKATEEAVLWNGKDMTYLVPAKADPPEKGIYQSTRQWMVEMDAKCAADRVLAGQPPSKQTKLSLWQRFLHWLLL